MKENFKLKYSYILLFQVQFLVFFENKSTFPLERISCEM